MKKILSFIGMAILAAAIVLGSLLILADVLHSNSGIKPASFNAVPVCNRVMT